MNISIKGTNLDLTEPLKDYVNEKVGHLDKFISGVIDSHVELERDHHHRSGNVFRAEVTMFVGGKTIRAEASTEDIYAGIDLVIPKLKEQLSKFKSKRETLERRGGRTAKRKQ